MTFVEKVLNINYIWENLILTKNRFSKWITQPCTLILMLLVVVSH